MKKKQSGIWLDFQDAYIINLKGEGDAEVLHIHSDVHHQATKGGSRSKSPWGPQFSPPDINNLERDKHAEKQYFEDILKHIETDTDELVIFGPAQAKIGLKKAIEHIKHYHPHIEEILPSDYLTERERVAWVKKYFKKRAEEKAKEEEEVG
ncbi:MAG: hypothetical protein IT270_15960 [Saprospiraceae bacterium]|nr:hypothetical protein [Saprospiraceae bacterium]